MSESTAPVTQSRGTSLLVLQPPRFSPLAPLVLTAGRWLIGTAAECDIRIETPGVQPQHALLLVSGTRVILKSLDVRTWVNDGLVQETVLRRNDRVAIGPLTFVVRTATADEVASALEEIAPSRQPVVAVPTVSTPIVPVPPVSVAPVAIAPIATSTSSLTTSAVMAPIVAMPATVPMPVMVPAPVAPTVPAVAPSPVMVPVPAVDRLELERRLNELASLENRLREAEASLRDRSTLAEEREQSLAHDQSSIEARHLELIQRDTDLAALAAETAIIRNELMVEQDELARLAADIDQRHLTLKAREEAYHQERQQWELQQQTIAEELQHRSRRLAEEEATQQQAWSNRQSELSQIASAIQEQLEECNERSEALDHSRLLIEQEREQASLQTDELKLQQAELAKRLAQLTEQEAQIDQWQQQLSARQSQLSLAEAELWARQKHGSSPEDTLASERDAAEIRRLQTLLDRVTGELSLVRSDNTALWSARDSLQQELANLQTDHARLVTAAELAQQAAVQQTPPLALVDSSVDPGVVDELREAAALLQSKLQQCEQELSDQAAQCEQSQARYEALQQEYSRAQLELNELQERCAVELAQREQAALERQAALEQASMLQQEYSRAQLELNELQERCAIEFQQREQVEHERHAALEQARLLQQEQESLASALEMTQSQQAEHVEHIAELEAQRFALEQEAAHWRRRADSAGELLALAATGWTDLAQQAPQLPPANPQSSEANWSNDFPTVSELPPELPRSAQQVWDRLDSVDQLLSAATSNDPADSADALAHLLQQHASPNSLPSLDEPAELTAEQPTPVEPASPEEPVSEEVSALRSELARLFDLPGMTASPAAAAAIHTTLAADAEITAQASAEFAESVAPTSLDLSATEAVVPWRQLAQESSAEHTPTDVTAAEAKPAATDDWQARLNSMFAATGTTPPPAEPVTAAPVTDILAEATSQPPASLTGGYAGTSDHESRPADSSSPAANQSDPEDSESISAYMARLLQRNSNVSSGAVPVAAPAPVVQPAPVIPPAPVQITPREAPAEDDFVEERPVAKRLPPQSLDSLRQVANLSARSAVARHSWQTVRGAVLLKSILLVLCIAGMATFFGGPLVGGQVFLASGIGCTIAGVWMAFDLGRTIQQMRLQQEELRQTLGSIIDTSGGHTTAVGIATVSEPEWSIVSDGTEPPPV